MYGALIQVLLDSCNAGNRRLEVLTFLPTSFLMHPVIDPPVTTLEIFKAFFNEVPKYASYSQISDGKILLLNRLA